MSLPGPRLNFHLVVPVLGAASLAVGLGMLVCFVLAVASGEPAAASFGIPAAIALMVGVSAVFGGAKLSGQIVRPRDGFAAVTLAWIIAATFGAVPFWMYEGLDDPAEAFFESMSGFTTMGATLMGEIDGQPHSLLLWRSLSQWLGGVGIVVLVVAIAPAAGLAGQRVFYAETTGVTSDRLTPRIIDTAKIICGIYLALTIVCGLAYALAGMSAFDAINHAMTTIATGGFSTHTDSIGHFDSLPIELIAVAFMLASGINFAFYWSALSGKSLWPQLAEVRVYLGIFVVSAALLATSLWLSADDPGGWAGLRDALFASTSVFTGTGYTTTDFDGWNEYARAHLLLLMFVGGCAGSTTGGIKVLRWILLLKALHQDTFRQLQPRAVQALSVRGKTFSDDIRRAVLSFTIIYVLITIAGTLAMAASGLDLVTAFSAAASAINIVGPGLGSVGAAESYSVVSDGGLWVLSLLMLMGRLEIFTVLVLFTPAFWRRRG